jgi:HTH-type transcriptional regulator / antitoxin HigA
LQEEGTELAAPNYDLQKYPFTAMFNEGYFNFFNGTLQDAKEIKEELLNRLFAAFQGMNFENIHCRTSSNEKMDKCALQAWHAQALTLANEQELPRYISGSLSEENIQYLVRLSAFDEGPLLVRKFLQKYGVPLITLNSLPKTYLDGACFKSPSNRPVIAMTLRHDRMDNFWFTLVHEIGHLFLHLDKDNFAFFDETETNKGRNQSRIP